MRYYEHNTEGFLTGWYNADSPRANSTEVAPTGISPARARWDGAAWVDDATQETTHGAARATEATAHAQAVNLCRSYDPATASAAEVRATLGAALRLLKRTMQELKD